jgi:hypothetical protein
MFLFYYYGSLQSNGIYLLDLLFHSHLKPIVFTSSATAIPHVAIVPGPISLRGGVIGPVNASAFATIFHGIFGIQ